MMEQGRAIVKQARKDMIDIGLIVRILPDSSQSTPRTPLKKQKSQAASPGRGSKLFEKNEEKADLQVHTYIHKTSHESFPYFVPNIFFFIE